MTLITLDRPKTRHWDALSVRKALADAFRVLHAVECRPGHKRMRAAWPEYMIEWSDEVGAVEKGTQRKTKMPRMAPRSIEISRMEMVLLGTPNMPCWLNGAVKGYPVHRRMLIAAVQGQARRYSGRMVAERLGVSHTSFQRHRDHAADVIAKQLNVRGIERW